MFEIYISHFNRNGTVIDGSELVQTIPSETMGDFKLVTPNVKCEMGNAEGLTFSIESGTKYYDAFLQMKTFLQIDYDGDTIFRGRVLTVDNGLYGTRKIRCEGPLAFFNDSSIEGSKESSRKNVTVLEYMSQLIKNHNDMVQDPQREFILGEVPGQYTSVTKSAQRIKGKQRKYGSDSWTDTKSALDDLRSHYGGYFRVRYGDFTYNDTIGQYGRGNIDLNNRVVIRNNDGTISTEKSFSTNIDGKEVLLPTIIDGKEVTQEQAIESYQSTGKYLGKFNTVAKAEEYAEKLHERQEWYYTNRGYILDWMDHWFNHHVKNQTFEVGKNIIDISSATEIDNIFTVLIPIGTKESTKTEATKATGTDNRFYLDNKELTVPEICDEFTDDELNVGYHTKEDYQSALEKYGRIIKTVTFDDAKDKADLKKKACEWIRNNYQGEVTKFTVKGIDLHQIGESNKAKIMVGDRVTLRYPVGSESGDTTTAEITRTCLSILYDLYNPENNQYTFGIPANVLTKSYGVTKQSQNREGGTRQPKNEPAGESEERNWISAVRDWLLNHKIYYDGPKPWSTGTANEWGPYAETYANYFYSRDLFGEFTLYKFIPIGSGMSEHYSQAFYEYLLTQDAKRAAEYLKQNTIVTRWRHYRNQDGDGHPSRMYVGTDTLTYSIIKEFNVIEYVKSEYGIDLANGGAGVKMPTEVTEDDGTVHTFKESETGELITASIFDPNSGATWIYDEYGNEIVSYRDKDGNVHYYQKDKDGKPKEVNQRTLIMDTIETNTEHKFITTAYFRIPIIIGYDEDGKPIYKRDAEGNIEYEKNDDGSLKMAPYGYEFGQSIENTMEGKLVVSKVDGDKIIIGGQHTRYIGIGEDGGLRIWKTPEGGTEKVEYGLYDGENLTGGIMIEKINGDESAMKIKASKVDIEGIDVSVIGSELARIGLVDEHGEFTAGLITKKINGQDVVKISGDVINLVANDDFEALQKFADLKLTAEGIEAVIQDITDNKQKAHELNITASGIDEYIEEITEDIQKTAVFHTSVEGTDQVLEQITSDTRKAAEFHTTVDGTDTYLTQITADIEKTAEFHQTVDGTDTYLSQIAGDIQKTAEFHQTVDGTDTYLSQIAGDIQKTAEFHQTVDGTDTYLSQITADIEKTAEFHQTVDGTDTILTQLSDDIRKSAEFHTTVDGTDTYLTQITADIEKTAEFHATVDGTDTYLSQVTDDIAKAAQFHTTVDGTESFISQISDDIEKSNEFHQTVDGTDTYLTQITADTRKAAEFHTTVDGTDTILTQVTGDISKAAEFHQTVDGTDVILSQVTADKQQAASFHQGLDGVSTILTQVTADKEQAHELHTTVEGTTEVIREVTEGKEKMHTLTRDINGLEETVRDEEGNMSELVRKANEIYSSVHDADGTVNRLSIKVTGFETSLTGVKDTQGNVTAASIATAINNQGQAGVKLDGKWIKITGDTTINDIFEVKDNGIHTKKPFVANDYVRILGDNNYLETPAVSINTGGYVRFSDAPQGYYDLNVTRLKNSVQDIKIEQKAGSTTEYSLYKKDVANGDTWIWVSDFKKAGPVTIRGTWSGSGNSATVSYEAKDLDNVVRGIIDLPLRVVSNGSPEVTTIGNNIYLATPIQLEEWYAGSGDDEDVTVRINTTVHVNAEKAYNNGFDAVDFLSDVAWSPEIISSSTTLTMYVNAKKTGATRSKSKTVVLSRDSSFDANHKMYVYLNEGYTTGTQRAKIEVDASSVWSIPKNDLTVSYDKSEDTQPEDYLKLTSITPSYIGTKYYKVDATVHDLTRHYYFSVNTSSLASTQFTAGADSINFNTPVWETGLTFNNANVAIDSNKFTVSIPNTSKNVERKVELKLKVASDDWNNGTKLVFLKVGDNESKAIKHTVTLPAIESVDWETTQNTSAGSDVATISIGDSNQSIGTLGVISNFKDGVRTVNINHTFGNDIVNLYVLSFTDYSTGQGSMGLSLEDISGATDTLNNKKIAVKAGSSTKEMDLLLNPGTVGTDGSRTIRVRAAGTLVYSKQVTDYADGQDSVSLTSAWSNTGTLTASNTWTVSTTPAKTGRQVSVELGFSAGSWSNGLKTINITANNVNRAVTTVSIPAANEITWAWKLKSGTSYTYYTRATIGGTTRDSSENDFGWIWTEAYNKFSMPTTQPSTLDTTFTVKGPSATPGTTDAVSYVYGLNQLTNDHDSVIVYYDNGTTSKPQIAKLTHGQYTAGRKAATVNISGTWAPAVSTAASYRKWTVTAYNASNTSNSNALALDLQLASDGTASVKSDNNKHLNVPIKVDQITYSGTTEVYTKVLSRTLDVDASDIWNVSVSEITAARDGSPTTTQPDTTSYSKLTDLSISEPGAIYYKIKVTVRGVNRSYYLTVDSSSIVIPAANISAVNSTVSDTAPSGTVLTDMNISVAGTKYYQIKVTAQGREKYFYTKVNTSSLALADPYYGTDTNGNTYILSRNSAGSVSNITNYFGFVVTAPSSSNNYVATITAAYGSGNSSLPNGGTSIRSTTLNVSGLYNVSASEINAGNYSSSGGIYTSIPTSITTTSLPAYTFSSSQVGERYYIIDNWVRGTHKYWNIKLNTSNFGLTLPELGSATGSDGYTNYFIKSKNVGGSLSDPLYYAVGLTQLFSQTSSKAKVQFRIGGGNSQSTTTLVREIEIDPPALNYASFDNTWNGNSTTYISTNTVRASTITGANTAIYTWMGLTSSLSKNNTSSDVVLKWDVRNTSFAQDEGTVVGRIKIDASGVYSIATSEINAGNYSSSGGIYTSIPTSITTTSLPAYTFSSSQVGERYYIIDNWVRGTHKYWNIKLDTSNFALGNASWETDANGNNYVVSTNVGGSKSAASGLYVGLNVSSPISRTNLTGVVDLGIGTGNSGLPNGYTKIRSINVDASAAYTVVASEIATAKNGSTTTTKPDTNTHTKLTDLSISEPGTIYYKIKTTVRGTERLFYLTVTSSDIVIPSSSITAAKNGLYDDQPDGTKLEDLSITQAGTKYYQIKVTAQGREKLFRLKVGTAGLALKRPGFGSSTDSGGNVNKYIYSLNSNDTESSPLYYALSVAQNFDASHINAQVQLLTGTSNSSTASTWRASVDVPGQPLINALSISADSVYWGGTPSGNTSELSSNFRDCFLTAKNEKTYFWFVVELKLGSSVKKSRTFWWKFT